MNFRNTPLVLALAAASWCAQAQTVAVQAPAGSVLKGDSFTLDVVAKDFPNKIFGGGFDVLFDASLLRLDTITFPANWELGTGFNPIDNAAGTATDVNFNTLGAPRAGSFLVSTLHFTALNAGHAQIGLSPSASWPYGDELFQAVDVTHLGTQVSITAVPEPQALALLMAGLGIAGVMGVRRQRHG